MKCKKKVMRILLTGLVWWALFYPDLYLAKDDCLVVECEKCEECDSQEDVLKKVCEAKSGQLILKSRLLEWIRAKEK